MSDPTSSAEAKAPACKHVLIEASKLADQNMDGIKRYVVELLEALSRLNTRDTLEVDVMVYDDIYTLSEALTQFCLPGGQTVPGKLKKSWADRLGPFLPPILLFPIKWLISEDFSRRLLGKKKADLRLPQFGLSLNRILLLLLPPVVVPPLYRFFYLLIPRRLVNFLQYRGFLRPLPRSVDPSPYDLVHHTLPNNGHYVRPGSYQQLVTVHDLCHIACPEFQTMSNTFTLRLGLDGSVTGGASFLTVSEATRTQLIEAYEIDPDRVTTAHNGCNAANFYPVKDMAQRRHVCQRYQIPDAPFLLTLSTLEPRKNLVRTIEAFRAMVDEQEHPGINLVIAGGQGWKSREILQAAGSCPDIYLTGYVADEDLSAIYSSARGFVYASHYEGFGLPLLEAMCCGVPVIYGNNSSMPEIVGEAGLPANSKDTGDILHQMQKIASDDELVEKLGRLALERSRQFTWNRTAERTMLVYNNLLGQS